MSKKIISTGSLLQQRPVLLRNKSASLTSGTISTSGKNIRLDGGESNSAQSEMVEIPIYYTEEKEKNESEKNSENRDEQPVVIPIVDSSKLKTKKAFAKDISYTEDGDSISFPLDCNIDGNEEESGLKVVIGSINRVMKGPQIFVSKARSNMNVKKFKGLVPGKREGEESVESQEKQETVLVDSREEPKYFSKSIYKSIVKDYTKKCFFDSNRI